MSAARLHTLLGAAVALVLIGSGLSVAAPMTAHAHRADWGKIARQDGILRRGCHDYAYRYRFTPPEGDWAVETFLVGPGGRPLGSGQLMTGYDEPQGRATLRICRSNTRAGAFRIKGKMTIRNGTEEVRTGWVVPARFRLRRP